MTVVETILVYAVAPLAVIAVLALLTLVPGRRKRPRYKPGQAWDFEPIWYEPHPEGGIPHEVEHGVEHGGGHALTAGASRPALTSGASSAPMTPAGPRGGARGTW